MIEEALKFYTNIVKSNNPFGERVTLVGATKTRDVETINHAISLGLKDIGENKPQEFRDKFPDVLPVNYHFFGRLQTNKVKYLIGKACLIQSVDSIELAKVISDLSSKNNVITNILLEVNLGEEQKGGFPFDSINDVAKQITKLNSLNVQGLMTVLPLNLNDLQKQIFCKKVRQKYDELKSIYPSFSVLSMGMTHDYQIAIDCGSNMIRIGTGIFGERTYKENDNGTI